MLHPLKSFLTHSFLCALFFLVIHVTLLSAAYYSTRGYSDKGSLRGTNHGYYRSPGYKNSTYGWPGYSRWPAYYAYYGYPLAGSNYYYSYPLNSSYYYSYPSYYTDYTYPSYPYQGDYYINNYRIRSNRFYSSYPSYKRYSYRRDVSSPSSSSYNASSSVGVFLSG